MRTSFLTSGKSPQNVKNTVVSLPIAAPVVARIRVGQILSSSPLQANMTSFSACPGFFSAICSKTSGTFSEMSVLMSGLLLLEDEAVNAAFLARLEQRVAGALRPGPEIGNRPRV